MDALRQLMINIAADFPKYEKLEVCGWVNEKSYAIEYFVTTNGVRRQCFEMVDNGELNEKQVDETILSIAKCVRTLPDYVQGELYNVNITVTP